MKKIIILIVLLSFFVGCGDKYPTKKDKLELAYKAIVLKDKDARKEMNKIDKKNSETYDKALTKIRENSSYKLSKKERQAFDYIIMRDHCDRELSNFDRGYKDGVKVPPLDEIIAQNGNPVSFEFRLFRGKDGQYFDILENMELFNGVAVKRNSNCGIEEVWTYKDGKKDEKIEIREYDWNGNVGKITYYKDNLPYMIKYYESYPNKINGIKIILERHPNGQIKKMYTAPNTYLKGEVSYFNKSGGLIKKEKLK